MLVKKPENILKSMGETMSDFSYEELKTIASSYIDMIERKQKRIDELEAKLKQEFDNGYKQGVSEAKAEINNLRRENEKLRECCKKN